MLVVDQGGNFFVDTIFKCVSGDFYVYNLMNDTVLIWLSYTQSNWIGKLDKFTVLPLDSVVLFNDPDICDKNIPGFRFFY
ncbi:MAG: hypothetical protein IPL98_10945 [Saprospiraceae bacterium]|nr:hypothetical protein [Saprospiraceae bacterium]